MSRKAILIESSNLKGEVDLPGARADVENYGNYLQSEPGGAWYSSEIVTLHKPSRATVLREVSDGHDKDYTFVAFFGHGYHLRGNAIDETKICLNEAEEMLVSELDPKNDRCLMLIDACRKVVSLLEAREIAAAHKMAYARTDRSPRSRKLFDAAVLTAEKGRITMYSCNLDESAGESAGGGTFSLALLECARSWAQYQTQDATFDSYRAFGCAQTNVTRADSRQHPEYQCGRRLGHFPFAVSLK